MQTNFAFGSDAQRGGSNAVSPGRPLGLIPFESVLSAVAASDRIQTLPPHLEPPLSRPVTELRRTSASRPQVHTGYVQEQGAYVHRW